MIRRGSQIELLRLLSRQPMTALQITKKLGIDRNSFSQRLIRLRSPVKPFLRIIDWHRQGGRGGLPAPVYAPTDAGRVFAGLAAAPGLSDFDVPPPTALSQVERDRRWRAKLRREKERAKAELDANRRAVDNLIERMRSTAPLNILWNDLVR